MIDADKINDDVLDWYPLCVKYLTEMVFDNTQDMYENQKTFGRSSKLNEFYIKVLEKQIENCIEIKSGAELAFITLYEDIIHMQ